MNILSSLQPKMRKELKKASFLKTAFCLPLTVKKAFLSLILFFFWSFSTTSQAVTITTSIPPLAGMIAPLLSENDHIQVILKPGASPHGFQLKPSNLEDLAKSDLILWVGTPVDNWMKKPIENLDVTAISMLEVPGLEQLPIRQGGLWDKKRHQHDVSNEEHSEEHHTQEVNDNHEHEHLHDEHKQGLPRMDGHLWMSLQNAKALIGQVSKELQKLEPQKADVIQQRTQAWLKKLTQTDLQIRIQLHDYKEQPYMVLHDAFQYFEHRYELNGIGSIQLNPSVSPSLKRVSEIREKIKQGGISCVFKEPQFPAKRVLAVTKGIDVRVGSLDPIGLVSKQKHQQYGTDYLPYDVFMSQLASQFHQCLAVGKPQ